jgi:serine/threonine-protein kinase
MMQAQEFRRMSDDHKGGGSDLDIFEGLGRKNSEKVPVAPPAPPGSSSHLPTARHQVPVDARRTLLGIPGPATPLGTPPVPPSTRPSSAGLETSHPQSGSMRTARSSSDAPPGRGSLPNLPASKSNPPIAAEAQRTSATHRVPSDPPPPYNPAPRHHSSHPPPAIVKARNGKLDRPDPYATDDDAAETNVFDRKKVEAEQRNLGLAPTEAFAAVPDRRPPTHPMDQVPSTQNAGGSGQQTLAVANSDGLDTLVASPAQQLASELASKKGDSNKSIPEPPDTASLSAAFAALGEREPDASSAPISKGLRSVPPASGAMRSAPPPPPPSMQKAGLMTQPLLQPPPPPPPPNAAAGMQTLPSMQQVPIPPPPVTQPYAMQPSPSPSAPPPGVSQHPSAPPPGVSAHPSAPPQSLPPVARLDATYTFPKKEKSGNGFVLAVLLTVVAIAGAAVWMFTPRTGNLVINVAGANGAPVTKLEVSIDGAKKCDSAPCIVKDIAAGTHSISVSAPGYDPVAARAVNVESRKDATTDFSLVAAKAVASAGTGVKVSGPAGAKLSVDGKDAVTLPAEIKDLTPGDHKLHFSGDRYAALDKTITVGKDEIVDVGAVPLKVTKGKATIQLGTPGAKVELVMGTTHKEVPQFPMAIEFDPAEKWELRATKDGMDPYSENIRFDDGQAEKTYNVTLQPKGTAAKEKTAAAMPAAVAHNDSSPAPAPAPKAKSTPKESSDSDEKPSKTTSASNADAKDTALKINSLPSSSVVLDGKPIGVTPLPHVTVTPGTHTIMFVNSEESLKKTITVEVKAGETKAAVAKLRE